MEKKYKKIFDEMHLSEERIKSIQEETEKIRNGKQKSGFKGAGAVVKIAATLLLIVMTGGAVTYAAQSYIQYQKERIELKDTEKTTKVHVEQNKEKTPDENVSAGAIDITNVAKDTDGNEIDRKSLYDVEVKGVPDGFKQDSEELYNYVRKREDGSEQSLTIILYRLTTDYDTHILKSKDVKIFQTDDKEGMYCLVKSRVYVFMTFIGTDYMVCLDGRNMDEEGMGEFVKMAKSLKLKKVSSEKEIQASFIEWTPECAQEVEEWQKQQGIK